MNLFMREYFKQEGFAVIEKKEHKASVSHWHCIHSGRYNNHRYLPPEVTDKTTLTERTTTGILFTNITDIRSYSTSTRCDLQTRLSFLCCFYRDKPRLQFISMQWYQLITYVYYRPRYMRPLCSISKLRSCCSRACHSSYEEWNSIGTSLILSSIAIR